MATKDLPKGMLRIVSVNGKPMPVILIFPLAVDGAIDNYDQYADKTDDCFYQPGDLYRLMTPDKKTLLINNTVADIMPVTENIKYRHAAHCYLADKEYGTRIAEGLHLDMKKVEELAAMTEPERLAATKSCCC
jgi:catalase